MKQSWVQRGLVGLARMVLGRSEFAVRARIEQAIPVTLDAPLTVPIDLTFNVDFEDLVRIEGTIPVIASIPIDTVIETELLKIGKVRIPIRANIPVSIQVPIHTQVKVHLNSVPVRIKNSVDVRVPPLTVPVDSTVQAAVSLT